MKKETLNNKIDFAVVISVSNANPNGDPLDSNRPRTTNDGLGEISDVCIKRKIRNRWQFTGNSIFVKSEEFVDDGMKSLIERLNSLNLKVTNKSKLEEVTKAKDKICSEWLDARGFGQLVAFKGSSLSIGIRGPISIQSAYSLDIVNITDTQITKSVNSEDKEGKDSSTMGMKYRVESGVYVIYGSVSPFLAEKTGFTKEDAEELKKALVTLFEGDSSSARPEGSMVVEKVYWFTHENKSGVCGSSKVHKSILIDRLVEDASSYSDYNFTVEPIDGVHVEELEGF